MNPFLLLQVSEHRKQVARLGISLTLVTFQSFPGTAGSLPEYLQRNLDTKVRGGAARFARLPPRSGYAGLTSVCLLALRLLELLDVIGRQLGRLHGYRQLVDLAGEIELHLVVLVVHRRGV